MFEQIKLGLLPLCSLIKGEKPLLTHGQQTAKWDLVFKDISTVIIRFRDLQLYQYLGISGRVRAVLLILLKKTLFLANKVFWICDSSSIVHLGAVTFEPY